MSKAGCYHQTFWNKKRVEAGLTQIDIADLLHVSPASAGQYMTGQLLPCDEYIEELCKFFNVDLREGTQAFVDANKRWDSAGTNFRHKLNYFNNRPIKQAEPEKEPEKKPEVEPLLEKPSYDPNKVVELIYGKIPFELFNEAYSALERGISPCKLLYGRIDYETFKKVEELEKSR